MAQRQQRKFPFLRNIHIYERPRVASPNSCRLFTSPTNWHRRHYRHPKSLLVILPVQCVIMKFQVTNGQPQIDVNNYLTHSPPSRSWKHEWRRAHSMHSTNDNTALETRHMLSFRLWIWNMVLLSSCFVAFISRCISVSFMKPWKALRKACIPPMTMLHSNQGTCICSCTISFLNLKHGSAVLLFVCLP